MDHLKAAGKDNYDEWHYEKPKLSTQNISTCAHRYRWNNQNSCNRDETSIQKSGDRHNIGWGRRRPVKTLIGMQKSHIIKMIRNPEHSEGTHKRKGRIDHV